MAAIEVATVISKRSPSLHKPDEADDKSIQCDPVTFTPLTISTIAVQSGSTKIVVALLQVMI